MWIEFQLLGVVALAMLLYIGGWGGYIGTPGLRGSALVPA